MADKHEAGSPVRVKAIVIDPASMTVVWMNEAALEDLAEGDLESASSLPVEQAAPMAALLGVPEVIPAVAETGVPQHLRSDLVSTARGSATLATSVYRLPDGMVLVLTEVSWRTREREAGHAARRRARHERTQ